LKEKKRGRKKIRKGEKFKNNEKVNVGGDWG